MEDTAAIENESPNIIFFIFNLLLKLSLIFILINMNRFNYAKKKLIRKFVKDDYFLTFFK